jgi:hypothetical protein
VEFWERLIETMVDHVAEAEELVALVTSISKVLMDLGLAPICGIPQVLNKAQFMLEVVGSVLERMHKVPTSSIMAQPYMMMSVAYSAASLERFS